MGEVGEIKEILDREHKSCYNGSMKRIDVLKGIEKILIEKAYESGHISHRADGDWQKQSDGSWKPYTGQSTPQTQEPAPTENTEYGEITEEDLVDDYSADENDPIVKRMREELWSSNLANKPNNKDLSQHLSNMHNQTIQSLLNDLENGKITEDQFKSQMSDLNNNIVTSLNSLDGDEEDAPDGEDDWDRYDDITDMIQNTDWESIVAEYDNPSVDQIMSDYDFPDDERIRDEISTYIHTDDSDENYKQDDEEVDKSAYRDMRSTPATKNMGF